MHNADAYTDKLPILRGLQNAFWLEIAITSRKRLRNFALILLNNTLRRSQRHQNIQAARTLQNTFRGSANYIAIYLLVIYYLIKATSSDDILLHSSRSKLDTQNISYKNPPHSSCWRQSLEIGTQPQDSTGTRVSSSSSCAQQTHTLTHNLYLSLSPPLTLFFS